MQQVSNPQPRNVLLSLVPGRACAHAAGERRVPLVCTHAHVPTVRSGAETAEGGAPAIPTLVGSDKKTTYNADNNNNAAPGTWAVLRCTYIARPPSLARRRSYWLYTAVPELIHILYRKIYIWYTTLGTGVFNVYMHRSPVLLVVRSSSTRCQLM